jgi:hypothetical protein
MRMFKDLYTYGMWQNVDRMTRPGKLVANRESHAKQGFAVI